MNNYKLMIASVLFLLQPFAYATGVISENLQYESSKYYQPDNSDNIQLEQGELAQLLAPIALYPDTLLTHILIATTYPLEIVHAKRWLTKHQNYTDQKIAKKLKKKEWDESVKVLISFPSVLKRLNDDLAWTQKIGDAFLLNESQVLESIQQLRRKAQASGSLDNMSNMTISYEQSHIVIEPIEQKVIYVPYYDTRVVYGHWGWSHYPPIFWHVPRNIYARHYSYGRYNPFYWHNAVHISAHFYFGAFHWHRKHVVVTPYPKRIHYPHHSRRKVVRSSGSKRWFHKPTHRRGVKYSHAKLNHRYQPKSRITKIKPHYVQVKNKLAKPHKNVITHNKAGRTVKHVNKVNKANEHKVIKNNKHVKYANKVKHNNKYAKDTIVRHNVSQPKQSKHFNQAKKSKRKHSLHTGTKVKNKVKHQTKTSYK